MAGNKICEFSKHTCNKTELFKLAVEENPFCPHVCCRKCSDKSCGVRCNGAIDSLKGDKNAERN